MWSEADRRRVATGYGQPSNVLYDWTLGSKAAKSDPNFALPSTISDHLRIERFAEKVSSTLFSNRQDAVGLVSDEERWTYVNLLALDFADMEEEMSTRTSMVTLVYLRAAHLHLRLSAFFSPPSLPSYRADLMKLYNSTTSLLDTCLGLDKSLGSLLGVDRSGPAACPSLAYGTNYIFQMMLAAGFALMKLHSSFVQQAGLDVESARSLFSKTIWALRSMSVQENDLAQRLAEVLAQVWKGSRAGAAKNGSDALPAYTDNSMELKVRCRMSVSLVYDSVWRWREEAQRRGISLEGELASSVDGWRRAADEPLLQRISRIPLIRPPSAIRVLRQSLQVPTTLLLIRPFVLRL